MSRTLVLVPTALERRLLAPALAHHLGESDRIELCGFGPVASAARTGWLLARHAPERVILLGIAGRLDERLAIGGAYRFDEVACFGVGAGSGADFVSAAALGWPQWPGDPGDPAAAIGDVIRLDAPADPAGAAGMLLTACAAAATAEDAAVRRERFPAAVAEDMEGFAVALACRLAGVPLAIVRGISNTAGDRDPARWQVPAALAAAADLAGRVLEAAR